MTIADRREDGAPQWKRLIAESFASVGQVPPASRLDDPGSIRTVGYGRRSARKAGSSRKGQGKSTARPIALLLRRLAPPPRSNRDSSDRVASELSMLRYSLCCRGRVLPTAPSPWEGNKGSCFESTLPALGAPTSKRLNAQPMAARRNRATSLRQSVCVAQAGCL